MHPTFIAVFSVAKIWKQLKYSSVDEWFKKLYIQTMHYFFLKRWGKTLPFATALMNLDWDYYAM